MATTRVKVERTVLIEKLEAKKVELFASFEKDQTEYDEAAKTLRTKVTAAISQLDKLSDADFLERVRNECRGSGWCYIALEGVEVPTKPDAYRHEHAIDNLNRHIRVLSMATNEFISVSTEDESAYLI